MRELQSVYKIASPVAIPRKPYLRMETDNSQLVLANDI